MEILGDSMSRAKYDSVYVKICRMWSQYREHKREAAEARRKQEEQRERHRQEEIRREQQARAARRRAEEDARRKQERQENARTKDSRKTEADRRSAEAAAKYRQEQANAANERLRKREHEEREREKQRLDELRRNKQQEADRRSAEAAARCQQERAAAAAERLRKRKQEEENREKERLNEIRTKKQREADLRSAAAAARCQQARAAAAKERLDQLQQEELERKKDGSAESPPKVPETERTHTETAPECNQEQVEPTDEGVHWNGHMWTRKGFPEHLEHRKARIRAFHEGRQQSFLQYSNSSRWPHEQKVHWIRSKFDDNVRPWAEQSRQVGGLPNLNCKKFRLLLKGCRQWMEWLEKLAISPQLRKDADLEDLLETVYAKEGFHFPEPLRERAKLLHARWEIIEWGERTSYSNEL